MHITCKSQANAASDTACSMLARGQPHALHEVTSLAKKVVGLHMCRCQSQCSGLSGKARLEQVKTGVGAERKHPAASSEQD